MKNLIKKVSILDQVLEHKTSLPGIRPKPPLRIKIRKLLRSFITLNQLKNEPLQNR